MCLLCQNCTPKQIDLQAFLVTTAASMLLLTSRCKSAAAQYKHCSYFAPPQKRLSSKSGHGTCITRLHKHKVSSFNADK